jgi:hypothetical protein
VSHLIKTVTNSLDQHRAHILFTSPENKSVVRYRHTKKAKIVRDMNEKPEFFVFFPRSCTDDDERIYFFPLDMLELKRNKRKSVLTMI